MNPIKLVTFIAPTVLGLGFAGAFAVPQVRDAIFHAGASEAAAAQEPQVDPEEQKHKALDNLLDCSNLVDNPLRRSERKYHSWVTDPEKGPTGRERTIIGMGTFDDGVVPMCNGKFEDNEQLQQFGDLAALGEAYKKAINDLIPKVDEAARYYNKDMFRADKFEKGKQMHPELEKAFVAFMKASDALSPEIEKHVHARAVASLARIEKESGRTLEYWHRKSMLDAKDVQRLMEGTVDYDKLEAALKIYEDDVTSIEKTAKAGKVPFMWDAYKEHPRAYYDAVAFYLKRHKNKIKYSRQEQMQIDHGVGADVPGSSDNVVKEFNLMVDGSNAVKYNM